MLGGLEAAGSEVLSELPVGLEESAEENDFGAFRAGAGDGEVVVLLA